MTRELAEAVARRDWGRLPHELKISLEPNGLDRLLAAAKLKASDGKRRRVWLFDTHERTLQKIGLTLRLRHKRSGGDFTVKVRPVLPSALTGRWLKSRQLELEADVVGRQRLLSASLEREVAKAEPRVSLSALQLALLREIAQVELPAQLRPTRPAEVTVWRPPGLTIERWELPRGGTALEVSATVPGTQLQGQRLWLDLFLEKARVRKARVQTTKTEALLRTL